MDRHMTVGTGPIRGWSVSGICLLVIEDGCRHVALATNCVDVLKGKELWIPAAVGDMAGSAPRLLHYLVFVGPWAGKIGVAFETRGYLLRECALNLLLRNGMGVVTNSALYGTIVDLMMNRGCEFGLDTGMASITKRRLRGFQQLPFLAAVDRVTTDTTNVSLSVRRLREAGMSCRMTTETKCIGLLWRNPGRIRDQGDIAVVLGV